MTVRVGVLTGGGDCPGLNAVIRAIVREGERIHGDELIGFLDAWDGVRERRTIPLTVETIRGTLPRGGTVLGTKRGSPFDTPTGVDEVAATIADLGIDALDRDRWQRIAEHRPPAVRRAAECRSSACRRRSTTTSWAPT